MKEGEDELFLTALLVPLSLRKQERGGKKEKKSYFIVYILSDTALRLLSLGPQQ